MHTIESKFVIGPKHVPISGVLCIFQPKNVACWGSEKVNTADWYMAPVICWFGKLAAEDCCSDAADFESNLF